MASVGVRIGPVAVATGGSVDLGYTAPAGGAQIVFVSAATTDGAAKQLDISIGVDAPGTRIFDSAPVNDGIPFVYRVFYPLAAGDTIEAGADLANLTLTIGIVEN